jgi:hypothetical protein
VNPSYHQDRLSGFFRGDKNYVGRTLSPTDEPSWIFMPPENARRFIAAVCKQYGNTPVHVIWSYTEFPPNQHTTIKFALLWSNRVSDLTPPPWAATPATTTPPKQQPNPPKASTLFDALQADNLFDD